MPNFTINLYIRECKVGRNFEENDEKENEPRSLYAVAIIELFYISFMLLIFYYF